jgi:hypothetical protein
MRKALKTTLIAALPLVSLLWVAPPAVAGDGYRSHGPRRSWSESYRGPYSGQYRDWERRQGYDSPWRYGKNQRKYNKAMRRLERQEREARARAYRRYEDSGSDRRYRRRLNEIDRRYDHKRHKVERNWGYGR